MIEMNDYITLKILGTGSFASVRKVRHKELGYVRAIKILTQGVNNDAEGDKIYKSFLKECSLLLRLGNGCHPNIIRVYQPRRLEMQAMVEMDYVDGRTINDYIKDCQHFVPYPEVLRFVREMGSALSYCHYDCAQYMKDANADKNLNEEELVQKYAVVHNDLHSNNIMKRRIDGSYVLFDFGLAIQDGEAVKSSSRRGGAPEYQPPEKLKDDVDNEKAVDVYSFGILMYEMLAGEVPFVLEVNKANSLEALNTLLKRHQTETPKPIKSQRERYFKAIHPNEGYVQDYPDWLEQVILKCLEKQPENRYQDAKELYDDILKHLKEDEVQTGSKEDSFIKEPVLPQDLQRRLSPKIRKSIRNKILLALLWGAIIGGFSSGIYLSSDIDFEAKYYESQKKLEELNSKNLELKQQLTAKKTPQTEQLEVQIEELENANKSLKEEISRLSGIKEQKDKEILNLTEQMENLRRDAIEKSFQH